jgi:hypothetical protein
MDAPLAAPKAGRPLFQRRRVRAVLERTPVAVGLDEGSQNRTLNLELGKKHMSAQSLLVILVVGLVAGWLAGQIVSRNRIWDHR